MKPTQRLFVDQPLAEGAGVAFDEGQARYLGAVLRLAPGAEVLVFNGRGGEWLVQITALAKRGGTGTCLTRVRAQDSVPDLLLCFAPIKGDRLEAIAEKATELGAAALQPVITERTIVRKVNTDRLRARCIEAAEQTGRLSVPQVHEPVPLQRLLDRWEGGRHLLFADEAGEAPPLATVAADLSGPVACLIGPEGGFTPGERALVRAHPAAVPVHLGPRILRADTAVFASLALVQAHWGDWNAAGR
jgi:16S rRNA (uracil1498-N3)-methyltransferase